MKQVTKRIIEHAVRLRTEVKRQAPVLLAVSALAALIWLVGCGASEGSQPALDSPPSEEHNLAGALCKDDEEDGITRPAHWTEASHCKGVDPDYDKLFDDTVVHRIDITIDPAVYQQTQDDLRRLLDGGKGLPGEDPMWASVKVEFDDKTWDNVGMRYKGNSSLSAAWREQVKKLAFRLTFDKFEDDHPELTNQRFYGFKKMTFSNGFKDDSLMRDKLAADIFRAGGVPAARGAFVRVFVDHGDGPVYFGLYTMIEDPSDELPGAQFGDGSGNLYKPDGQAASWVKFVREHFEKKTNEEEADWSDVEGAIAALHSTRRQTDPAAWRKELERVFDAKHFLRCLALNQAMENWDSYGFMTHNYYIYGDPSDRGVLKWIPWDLNEAMLHVGRGPNANSGSILLDELGDNWPLIRFLLDDEVYREVYRAEVDAAAKGAFSHEAVKARVEAYHALIAPFVSGVDGERPPHSFIRDARAFDGSVQTLLAHVAARHDAIAAALR